jgi:hypothetical protein
VFASSPMPIAAITPASASAVPAAMRFEDMGSG